MEEKRYREEAFQPVGGGVFFLFPQGPGGDDGTGQEAGATSDKVLATADWWIRDAGRARIIRVRLSDFAETSNLDPKLFVLTDPRRKVGKP